MDMENINLETLFLKHRFFGPFSRRCSGQNNCSVQASSIIFDDPCPNTSKYLEVHFKCSSGKFGIELDGSLSTSPISSLTCANVLFCFLVRFAPTANKINRTSADKPPPPLPPPPLTLPLPPSSSSTSLSSSKSHRGLASSPSGGYWQQPSTATSIDQQLISPGSKQHQANPGVLANVPRPILNHTTTIPVNRSGVNLFPNLTIINNLPSPPIDTTGRRRVGQSRTQSTLPRETPSGQPSLPQESVVHNGRWDQEAEHGDLLCESIVYKQIEWPATRSGFAAVRPCPRNASGRWTWLHRITSAEQIVQAKLFWNFFFNKTFFRDFFSSLWPGNGWLNFNLAKVNVLALCLFASKHFTFQVFSRIRLVPGFLADLVGFVGKLK